MALRPTEKMVHNNIGLIYFRQEKYSQALEEYNKELELNPLYDVAWYNLGLLYYRLGELDKAAKAWHNTLVVNPEYLDAIYALQALAEEQKNTNNIND
jgi:tetratricopeptide (TPR) repeat protein